MLSELQEIKRKIDEKSYTVDDVRRLHYIATTLFHEIDRRQEADEHLRTIAQRERSALENAAQRSRRQVLGLAAERAELQEELKEKEAGDYWRRQKWEIAIRRAYMGLLNEDPPPRLVAHKSMGGYLLEVFAETSPECPTTKTPRVVATLYCQPSSVGRVDDNGDFVVTDEAILKHLIYYLDQQLKEMQKESK